MEQLSNYDTQDGTLSNSTSPLRQRVSRIWNNILISLLKIKHFHSNSTLGKRFLGYEQHSNTIKIETLSIPTQPLGKWFLGYEQHSNTIKIVLGKRFLGMEQHSNTIKMETLSIPTQPVRQRVLSFQLNFRN